MDTTFQEGSYSTEIQILIKS